MEGGYGAGLEKICHETSGKPVQRIAHRVPTEWRPDHSNNPPATLATGPSPQTTVDNEPIVRSTCEASREPPDFEEKTFRDGRNSKSILRPKLFAESLPPSEDFPR
jgi:hypothetical protein